MRKYLFTLIGCVLVSLSVGAEDYLRTDGVVIALDDVDTAVNSGHAGKLARTGVDYQTRTLTVTGQINGADLTALWRASLRGNLAEIDLRDAEIEDGVIPDFAFWNESEQTDAACGHTEYLRLRRIVLPKNTVSIGRYAFANALYLDDVVLPDGLEKIDEGAFYNCGLREVALPASCVELEGTSHFMHNVHLAQVQLPEGIEVIPPSFVEECTFLEDINVPTTVRQIGERAFLKCRSLKSIQLSPVLETVGDLAFWGVDAMEEISFPATLKSLGKKSCEYMTVMRNIYCASPEPPVCEKIDTDTKDNYKPFGANGMNYHKITWEGARVHVPVGSADKYRNAWGWNYFTHFVETDEFPDASVGEITVENTSSHRSLYDLHGRQVANPQPGHLYIADGEKIVYKQP